MIEAIIFDIGDLLVYFKGVQFKANQAVFSKFGILLTEEEFRRRWVVEGTGSLGMMRDYFFPSETTVNDIRRMRWRAYENSSHELKIMPGAYSLINMLKQQHQSQKPPPPYPLAAVSSSRQREVIHALHLFGLESAFDVFVCRESVDNVKPHPEPYYAAARMLGKNPKKCLVFEDSPKGVYSAKRANMMCIAIPSKEHIGEDFSNADIVLPSLERVTLEMILELSQRLEVDKESTQL